MNVSAPTSRGVRKAAVAAAIGFVGIAVFQIALAARVPLGHAAWGGAHAHLSTAQRLGSATPTGRLLCPVSLGSCYSLR
jgi:hypothetical protein